MSAEDMLTDLAKLRGQVVHAVQMIRTERERDQRQAEAYAEQSELHGDYASQDARAHRWAAQAYTTALHAVWHATGGEFGEAPPRILVESGKDGSK